MSKDIIQFEKEFQQATREAMFETKEVIKTAISTTFKNIVIDTPVGDVETGRNIKGNTYVPGNLKGNWQISFNSPETSEIDRQDASGSTVISEINTHMNSYIMTDTVYFSNNASYADIIESEGGSRKAPAGMMRINVLKFNDVLMRTAASKGKK